METFSENLESWVLGPGNTEISVKFCNFSILWSQDARLKISGETFFENLESWVLGPGDTEISVYLNFSILWSQDARLKISVETFSENLESWVLGPGNTEISVFYGPKTQDSRFQGKLFLKILSLGSWDREILKFQ